MRGQTGQWIHKWKQKGENEFDQMVNVLLKNLRTFGRERAAIVSMTILQDHSSKGVLFCYFIPTLRIFSIFYMRFLPLKCRPLFFVSFLFLIFQNTNGENFRCIGSYDVSFCVQFVLLLCWHCMEFHAWICSWPLTSSMTVSTLQSIKTLRD